MPNIIDLISSSFSTEKSLTYRLSIREFPNGFSFCVVDSKTGRCVAIKRTPTLSQDEPLLTLRYSSIHMVKDAAFSVVPQAFLQGGGDCAAFLPIGQHLKKRAVTQCNTLTDGENAIVFDSKKFREVKQTEEKRHPLQELYGLGTSLQKADYCLAEMDGTRLNLLTVCRQRLQLLNSFDYETMEDAAYYILSVYQQSELDVEKIPLYIIADTRDAACPKEFLKEYIRQINTITPGAEWDPAFQTEYHHIFATQLHSLTCVS